MRQSRRYDLRPHLDLGILRQLGHVDLVRARPAPRYRPEVVVAHDLAAGTEVGIQQRQHHGVTLRTPDHIPHHRPVGRNDGHVGHHAVHQSAVERNEVTVAVYRVGHRACRHVAVLRHTLQPHAERIGRDGRSQRVGLRRCRHLAVGRQAPFKLGDARRQHVVLTPQREEVLYAEEGALHRPRHTVGIGEDLGLGVI